MLIPAIPLEDLLTPERHARTIWHFVLGLDLTPLYATIRAVQGGPGRPATDPPILVALWLYATVEGIGSARALDYLCSHHHGFRWMWGGVSLHYHTRADDKAKARVSTTDPEATVMKMADGGFR
ncbi:MAG: hypothetical protein ACYC3I_28195, partial [Gemmataceae bacterium]